jgi:hypothetical protein
VLRHVWTNYEIQDEILGWLSELIDDSSSQVMHARVSYALGVLARLSFEYVQVFLFNAWSTSDEFAKRDAVAYALREASRDPIVAPTVERFTDALFANTEVWQAQATAARIYGVGLGRPRELVLGKLHRLTRFHRMGSDTGSVIAIEVARSMASLILENPQEGYPDVLDQLMRWGLDHRDQDASHLIFLIIAKRIVRTVSATGQPGAEASWPDLLYVAQNDPAVRRRAIDLWAETLQRPFVQHLASLVLYDWARAAEGATEICSAFARFMRAVANTDPSRGLASTLLRLVDDWVDEDAFLPLQNVAAVVRPALLQTPGSAVVTEPGSTSIMPIALV